jgi:hypothetical protein
LVAFRAAFFFGVCAPAVRRPVFRRALAFLAPAPVRADARDPAFALRAPARRPARAARVDGVRFWPFRLLVFFAIFLFVPFVGAGRPGTWAARLSGAFRPASDLD